MIEWKNFHWSLPGPVIEHTCRTSGRKVASLNPSSDAAFALQLGSRLTVQNHNSTHTCRGWHLHSLIHYFEVEHVVGPACVLPVPGPSVTSKYLPGTSFSPQQELSGRNCIGTLMKLWLLMKYVGTPEYTLRHDMIDTLY